QSSSASKKCHCQEINFLFIVFDSILLLSLGLGTMGQGIVTSLVKANIPVVALEQNLEYLNKGRKAVMLLLEREAMKMEEGAQTLDFHNPARLQFTVDFDLMRDVDLVIEAVFENMALKKEIFHKLSKISLKKV
uniref:3-hydroxyacyl-CoA dehydrogenase NAD binding domain-containing protein n=1 Tax=Cyanistes caeruleus TaxID=156563 RepID=A0A8C0VEK8_CYACU